MRPVPQFEVAQDLLDDRSVADQAEDLHESGAPRADQGGRLVDFLYQPGPGAPAGARELVGVVAIVPMQSRRLGRGRRTGCAGTGRYASRIRPGPPAANIMLSASRRRTGGGIPGGTAAGGRAGMWASPRSSPGGTPTGCNYRSDWLPDFGTRWYFFISGIFVRRSWPHPKTRRQRHVASRPGGHDAEPFTGASPGQLPE
jgi:hypothetical protein